MREFTYIHYLRGIAALLVVVHHILSPNPYFVHPFQSADLGAAGVALFFVISGFIMYTICRHERVGEFTRRRLLRIVPLYWLATSVKFLMINHERLADFAPPQHLREYVLSLLFIPHVNYRDQVSIAPMLYQGWTLNLEMLFYALFAMAIFYRMPVKFTAVVILLLVSAGALLPMDNVASDTFTRPIMLLFLGGIALGWMRENSMLGRLALMLPLGVAMLMPSALGLVTGAVQSIAIGLSAMMIVGGAVAYEQIRPVWKSNLLHTIGSASYAIYLSHTFFFVALVEMVARLPLPAAIQFPLVLVLVTSVCTVLGVLIHRMIEMPLLRHLNSARPKAVAG